MDIKKLSIYIIIQGNLYSQKLKLSLKFCLNENKLMRVYYVPQQILSAAVQLFVRQQLSMHILNLRKKIKIAYGSDHQ
jgi:hypothetical protein